MKGKILILASSCLLATMAASAQQRMSLYEEFTGENCPPCAGANPGVWALAQANTSKMLLLKYQSPIPSAGPIYNQYTADYQNRGAYYSVPFAPYGRLDGAVLGTGQNPGHVAYLTQAAIDAASAITSKFVLTATAQYNVTNDSFTAVITIKTPAAYAPSGGNLKLRTALCQTLEYTISAGSNGEKDFENVIRHMYPDANGTAISNSWTANQTVTMTVKGAIPANFTNPTMGFTNQLNVGTTKDAFVAVWIENDANKVVEQANRTNLMFKTSVNTVTNINDLTIFPNPTSDKATVGFSLNENQNIQVQLTDVTGKVVYSLDKKAYTTGKSTIEISTANLASGVYNLTLSSDKGQMTEKIVVNR